MSLLNDALRKRRGEQQKSNSGQPKALSNQGTRFNGKQRWQLYIGLMVISLAVSGGWLYWTESNAASNVKSSLQAVASPDPQQLQALEQAAGDDPSATVQAEAAMVLSKPVAAPAKPDNASATPIKAANPKPQTNHTPQPVKPLVASKSPAMQNTPPLTEQARSTTMRQQKAPPEKQARPRTSLLTHKPPAKGSPAQSQIQSKRLYQKARQFHRGNRLAQAVALYQEVIKIDPEHYKARFNLASAYLQTESYPKAFAIISDLHRRHPDRAQVTLNLAIAHIGLGQHLQALELLENLSSHPQAPNFEIALHKGLALSHLDRPQEAIGWYKRAETMRPDDKRLLFNIAVISDQQQQYLAAVHYYRRHLDGNPDIDDHKAKQIRHRIRTLQAYRAKQTIEE